MKLIFNVDGGSRGNPGPAGFGVLVADANGAPVARLKGALGRQTNNYAEYQGLLAALRYAREQGAESVEIRADSQLMVMQMKGRYRVNSETLRPLFEEAQQLARSFRQFRIEHVYREGNSEADRLANEAMDEAAQGRTSAPTAAAKLAKAAADRDAGPLFAAAGSATPARPATPDTVAGVVRNGQVVTAEPVAWEEGTRLIIRRLS